MEEKEEKESVLSKKNIYKLISSIIILTLTLAIIDSIIQKNWIVLFTSILTLILVLIPIFFHKKYPIKLSKGFEIIIVIFIYASIFLGEVKGFYEYFWWWDLVLHATSAIVFAFIGFTILFLMYSKQNIQAKPVILAIFAFTFAIAIGTIWEIFEFTMDQLFNLHMQKSGLIDTMIDLIVDVIGALFSSIITFFYFKKKKKPISFNK
jgi:hypothetical protein